MQTTLTTTGSLALEFEADSATQRTHMHVREQHPPLKVVRAFAQVDGAASVHLHNVSGGVLAGDKLEMRVQVRRDARAQITSTSATRLYRRRSPACANGMATQRNIVQVDEDGLLEYVPDPIIPFAHAQLHQLTQITLAQGAGLIWWEVLSPGREAHGERFVYDELTMQTEIDAMGLPITREWMQLRPDAQPLRSLAQFGGYGHYATMYVCRVGADIAALEDKLSDLGQKLTRPGEVVWGASALVGHGVAVRGLAHNGRILTSGLHTFWQYAKRVLHGRTAVLPRKMN